MNPLMKLVIRVFGSDTDNPDAMWSIKGAFSRQDLHEILETIQQSWQQAQWGTVLNPDPTSDLDIAIDITIEAASRLGVIADAIEIFDIAGQTVNKQLATLAATDRA